MDTSNLILAKKAVHVKWAGKTIALGTFPVAEADEKCARAKALTRAWRSTMRPKPTREWVMQELERMGVRIVSGRQGKEDEEAETNAVGASGNNPGQNGNITPSLLNAADIQRAGKDFDPNKMMAAHNASYGGYPLEGFGGGMRNMSGRGSMGLGNMGMGNMGMGNMVGGMGMGMEMRMPSMKKEDSSAPPHRPLVGGGAAAAYEAAREQHYRDLAERKRGSDGDFFGGGSIPPSRDTRGADRNVSHSGGEGAAAAAVVGGGDTSYGGLSATASQHYEMLKLHHMNLLNEIQETTLMMNIYQQQQLQQQKQTKQQQQVQSEFNNGSQNADGNKISQSPKKANVVDDGEYADNDDDDDDDESDNDDDDDDDDGGDNDKGYQSGKASEEKPMEEIASQQKTHANVIPSEPKEDSNENREKSKAERLQKIKAEIEERQRMLMELAEAEDDAQPTKKSRIENSSAEV